MSILGNWLKVEYSSNIKWTPEPGVRWQCSECGRVQKQISNFCPYCGANMIFADREPTVKGIVKHSDEGSCGDFNNTP